MNFKERIIRYEELKIKEKELKTEINELKELILPEIDTNQVIELQHGKLSVRVRSSWEYSAATEQMAADLEEKQNEEKASGEAEAVVSESLTYTLTR